MQTHRILILNGPNLNLLGRRQPEIYGSKSFEQYFETLQPDFPDFELQHRQSNHEGVLIDELHRAGFDYFGIVLNPGGYSHTSVALADAIRSIGTPVIEVHLSNIHARESYRKHSFTAEAAKGIIGGFGLESYRLALYQFRTMAWQQNG